MQKLKYSNIFEAIADDAQEAADLEFRADLMLMMREYSALESQRRRKSDGC